MTHTDRSSFQHASTCIMLTLTVLLLQLQSTISFAPFIASTTNSRASSRLYASTESSDVSVASMPEPLPTTLHNKYYFLRHGQSTANVAGIISSARSLAYSDKHGLTPVGVEQGSASAGPLLGFLQTEMKNDDEKQHNVIFISSPFARARQTAEACLNELTEQQNSSFTIQQDIDLDERLMERFFGRLDNEAIYTYAYVWPMDRLDVTHTAFDVESVAAVCLRFREFIMDLESKYNNNAATMNHIVMASHADVCQIAQLYAANVDNVGEFSSYRFQNGEVRPMKVNDSSALPKANPLEAPKRGTQQYSDWIHDGQEE